MEIGIDSFAAVTPDPVTGERFSGAERLDQLLAEIETADSSGLDVFGVGEHHREEFLDSAPAVILAAAAARTKTIRLTSAVTVLSAADPVRVFQEYATLDLLSKGRAELVVGRGSFAEAFPLFGLTSHAYDDLFIEKLQLLLQLREQTYVTWAGRFRPPLTGQGVFPRPFQERLPVWVGVGGTPASFARAGTLGLPLMIAIIGGTFQRFRPLVDLYRKAARDAGHDPATLKVGVHAFGFVGETFDDAVSGFYPGWAHSFARIRQERGWPPAGRREFDAMCGPDGAYLVGGPAMVADKVMHLDRVLGGVSRVTFQMSAAALDPIAMQKSIRLLGREVKPRVRTLLSQDGDKTVLP